MKQPTVVPQTDMPSTSPWLATLLLRQPQLAGRFVCARASLARLSRPRRLRLVRRLGLSLSAAAVMLALAGPAFIPSARAATNATIIVTNGEVGVVSNGKCSLIEAINNANAKTGRPHSDCVAGSTSASVADVVQLPTNGAFSLTAVAATSYYGYSGLPIITSKVFVAGNGSRIERVANSPEFRFFEVAKGTGDLTLQGVTLSGGLLGNYYGGAVYARGDLRVTNSTLSGNVSATGGAIAGYQAKIIIETSTFSTNTADQQGGAVYMRYGNLTVTGSTFTGNEVAGGGGAIYGSYTPVTISGCTLTDNYADSGGAVGVVDANLSITGSTLSGNNAYIGGAIYVRAAYADKYKVTLRESTISDNIAYEASALSIYTMGLNMDRTTVSGNQSTSGYGAVVIDYADATISNSTISNNSGVDSGGLHAIFADVVTLANVTVTGNRATEAGGGIRAQDTSKLTLSRTIVSGNSAPKGPEIHAADTTVTANSFNLFGVSGAAGVVGFTPTTTGSTADIVPTAAIGSILGALANNGGSTKTHALPLGSPAIDRALTAACNSAPVNSIDQRGMARSANGNGATSANECDIGAFEMQPPTSIASFTPGSAAVGATVTINGANLTGATGVSFGGVAAATFSVKSAAQMTAVVPPGAKSGPIVVTAPGGTATSSQSFTVIYLAPTVTKFAPTKAAVGSTVTITGKDLSGVTAVTFNKVPAVTFTSVSATTITAVVPVGATSGKIAVTTPGGTKESKNSFSVAVPAPTVTSFSPKSGKVGIDVTIIGTNLTGATSVKFGSKTATIKSNTDAQLIVVVPTGATTGVISITTPGGTVKTKDKFTVVK